MSQQGQCFAAPSAPAPVRIRSLLLGKQGAGCLLRDSHWRRLTSPRSGSPCREEGLGARFSERKPDERQDRRRGGRRGLASRQKSAMLKIALAKGCISVNVARRQALRSKRLIASLLVCHSRHGNQSKTKLSHHCVSALMRANRARF